MKKVWYCVIWMMTVVLMALLIVCIAFSLQTFHIEPFAVEIRAAGLSENIKLWQDEKNDWFVFLPSYAELENVIIKVNGKREVFIDEYLIENGMSCDVFAWNTVYDFKYYMFGKEKHQQLSFVRSANIPAMYIDTASGSMKYIHAKKGNEETGTIRLYTAEGELCNGENLKSIRGRGNNTWTEFEKKPYSISLEQDASLLDMGDAIEWILLANADDSSHMRNKIVYDFANDVGLQYSPESRWVDLYLNGEYAGLYQLSERNEVHSERINIVQDDGWLVSLEVKERLKTQKLPYVETEKGQTFRIHYPTAVSDEQKEEILEKWESFEKAILSGNELLNESDWMSIIDLDSWIKKYLIEEIFTGPDSCLVSQFFYYHEGLIYAGPVWDYDHTLGHTAYWQLVPESLNAKQLYAYEGVQRPWFSELYEKEEFYKCLVSTFEKIFLPCLAEIIEKRISQYADLIQDASEMNRIRWNCEREMKNEAVYIIEFLTKRIDFLTRIWINEEQYYCAEINPGNGEFYGYFYLLEDDNITIDVSLIDNGWFGSFEGWYNSDTNEKYDIAEPVNKDIKIYAKWERAEAFSYNRLLLQGITGVFIIMAFVVLIADIRRGRKGG